MKKYIGVDKTNRKIDTIKVKNFKYQIIEYKIFDRKTRKPKNYSTIDIELKINGKTPHELFGHVADFCFSPCYLFFHIYHPP